MAEHHQRALSSVAPILLAMMETTIEGGGGIGPGLGGGGGGMFGFIGAPSSGGNFLPLTFLTHQHHVVPLTPNTTMPGPITTLDFPDPQPTTAADGGTTSKRRTALQSSHRASGAARSRKRARSAPPVVVTKDDGCCCVCLDTLSLADRQQQLLPCKHRLHARCLWGVLTSVTLGASSMMRCPLCRCAIDRHDLQAMGYAVGPARLGTVARACRALWSLVHNDLHPTAAADAHHHEPRAQLVARAVRRSAGLSAVDGFLYNTCILSLERMLHHKINFVHTLREQLAVVTSSHRPNAGRRPTVIDRADFIASSLACHVDVLIHTANHLQPENVLVDPLITLMGL